MPAYKDEKRKTWMARFTYTDWQGKTKWVTKRGFSTKREALEYEREFKLKKAGDYEMLFKDFVERYKEEVYPRIKYSTTITKDNILDNRITPYFGEKKLSEITTQDVIQWQNEMISFKNPETGKEFSKSYLKTLHNHLSAVLNYAVKFYGLRENVAAKVGNMGSENEITIDFWTREEYERFAEEAMEYPMYYYCFEVLYWTGMRVGELLALTLEDIDLEGKRINISKTYHRLGGEDIVTSPKTPKSVRTIDIPEFLADELQDYIDMNYDIKKTDRLFPTYKGNLGSSLKKCAAKAGVKPIRIHDLRHSHISLLVDMGYSAVAIGDRVGHESVEITYRYSHMFPSVQKNMAEKLNENRCK